MKIGFVCLPLSGHVLPVTSLMRKLRSRGHEVVYLGFLDTEPILHHAELSFLPYGAKPFPRGSMADLWEPIVHMHGVKIMQYCMANIFPKLVDAALNELPHLLTQHKIDALVADTTFYGVQLAAMSVGIPFVQIYLALHRDPTGTTPPTVFSWPYETTPEALARNKQALEESGETFVPLLQVGRAFAEQTNLSLDLTGPGAMASKLALITQTPKEFDFPIFGLPSQWHYTGPFHDGEGRRPVPFPWERLDGRTLVYVSLGTAVNGQERLFRIILEAVGGMPDLQVVLSTGDRVAAKDFANIAPNAILVERAPQLELLKQAALCITHAGLNTVLEALAQGVPLLAIPIGFDQPGVASRIAYHHTGEFIEVEDLTVQSLSALIRKILAQPEYRDNAQRFGQIIAQNRGLDLAAEIVERAFADAANGALVGGQGASRVQGAEPEDH